MRLKIFRTLPVMLAVDDSVDEPNTNWTANQYR